MTTHPLSYHVFVRSTRFDTGVTEETERGIVFTAEDADLISTAYGKEGTQVRVVPKPILTLYRCPTRECVYCRKEEASP